MLELKTFGGLRLEADGVSCGGAAARPRSLALLALLAAGHQEASREKLIACLWPETDDERGRHLLKQACHDLRRELRQPELFLGRRAIRLNPGVITSDVQRLEGALGGGDHARAVTEYCGPFLDGFYLEGNSEFEHWVDAERDRLARQVGSALEALAREATAKADHARAAEWWRRLAELDPLSAEATVGRMTALAAARERAEALVVGREYVELVRRELDAEPASAVTTLLQQLRSQSEEIVVKPRFPVRPTGSAGPGASHAAREPVGTVVRSSGSTGTDAPHAGHEPGATGALPRPIAWRRRTLLAVGALAAVVVVVASTLRAGPASAPMVIAVGTIHDYARPAAALPAAGVTELLETNLARLPELQVISATRLHEIAGLAAGGDTRTVTMRAARDAGATDLLEGALFQRPEGRLRLQLRLVDVRTGVVRRAVVAEERDPVALVDLLTGELAQGLAAPRH